MAVSAVVVGVSAFVIDEHAVAVKPPAVTGSVTLQAVRNTDPQASRFLDDVGRSEPGWLSMPGTFVEGTVRWHLPHRLDPDSCQVAVQLLPEAPMRLGAQGTGTIGTVAMGDDFVLKKAFGEPGPATSLGGRSYIVGPSGTDGTISFVVAYPDQQKVPFDGTAARASAVVECANHVAGPVSAMAVSQIS